MMLSDVCRIHPVGGQRVHIGWSGPAWPAWLKAATAHFHCRPGLGHIVAAAHLQRVVHIFSLLTNNGIKILKF